MSVANSCKVVIEHCQAWTLVDIKLLCLLYRMSKRVLKGKVCSKATYYRAVNNEVVSNIRKGVG